MRAQVTVSANDEVKTYNVEIQDGLLPIPARKAAVLKLKSSIDEQGLRFDHNAKFYVWLGQK